MLIDGEFFNYISFLNEFVIIKGFVVVVKLDNNFFVMVFLLGILVIVKVVLGVFLIVFVVLKSFKN